MIPEYGLTRLIDNTDECLNSHKLFFNLLETLCVWTYINNFNLRSETCNYDFERPEKEKKKKNKDRLDLATGEKKQS